MQPQFDTSDPLGALMTEWKRASGLFPLGVAAAAFLTFTKAAGIAWVLGLLMLGMLLILLGQTVVIVGNELRKAKRVLPEPFDDAQ